MSDKIKMLVDTKGLEVFLSKKSCLNKEALPGKFIIYFAEVRLG